MTKTSDPDDAQISKEENENSVEEMFVESSNETTPMKHVPNGLKKQILQNLVQVCNISRKKLSKNILMKL